MEIATNQRDEEYEPDTGEDYGSAPWAPAAPAGHHVWSVTLTVSRARLHDEAGEQEWKSDLLPAYKRLSHRAEALIAEVYLAGMNTRRARRALARLFEGHVGKNVVSRLRWLPGRPWWPSGARRAQDPLGLAGLAGA